MPESEDLTYRSKFLLTVFDAFVRKEDTILEIGAGDGRNLAFLRAEGYDVEGIDKAHGTAIEDVPPKQYDVIFTMSTLFLIPPENAWVFKKIADMTKRCLITIEGETTNTTHGVWGRDYREVFEPLGFVQVAQDENIFNKYGHLRVFRKSHQ